MFRVDSSPVAHSEPSGFATTYIPFSTDVGNLSTPSLASPSFAASTNSYATPLTPVAEHNGTGFPFTRPTLTPSGPSTYSLELSPAPIFSKPLPTADMLEVIYFGPSEGPERTAVTIRVNADFPPSLNPSPMDAASPTKTLRVLFGSVPVQTRVGGNAQPMRSHTGGERYQDLAMHANAPSAHTTGCVPPGGSVERTSCPVYVQVLDAAGSVLETAHVGQFMYQANSMVYGSPLPSPRGNGTLMAKRSTDHLSSGRSSPRPQQQLNATIMRKMPSESLLPGQSPTIHSHESMQRAYAPSRYGSSPAMDFSPQDSPLSSTFNQYGEPQADSWGQPNGMPQHPQAQPIQHHDPHQSYPPHSSSSSDSLPQAQLQQMPPAAQGQPSLLRTSQLTAGGNGFNPYVAGNSKAKLELQQDLNLMAVGWNNEEWNAKRRLVQFWRRQEGATIHAAFRAISQSEYIPNSIVISCIYREDKNECFVTSVDAIYLLEALVGVRFSVEEKNRIRRNLEGFRPITVSKSKAGAEDFFKLVMGFPNPKPRNIEKDVKVFPWSIFGTALKKIIGKYSASYVLPQSSNMGPPQPPSLERNSSPAPAPYTIPAPLMPADPSMGFQAQPQYGSPVQFHPQHPQQMHSPMPHSPMGPGPYQQQVKYEFEVNDVFLAPSSATPGATTYHSGGSLPTVAHPSPVASSTGSASNSSGMIPMSGGGMMRQASDTGAHGGYDGGMYH